jgi:signal transduction histidine kinase
MRWSIRYQLLLPLLTLLIGVAGISTWTAIASAARARQQIEMQVRQVARTLSESRFPLTQNVLEQMKGLSGAEYLVVSGEGRRTATFPIEGLDLPPAEAVADDWQSLHLGPPVTLGGQLYLCSGVRLSPARAESGSILYLLYPEALWRDALWQAVRPSLVLGGFVGLASVVLAVGVAQRLSRRIQKLERRTRLIAAGDFSPMPLSSRDDELRDLAQSVNDMAGQLAQLEETVRKHERLRLLGQVSVGLAHQLRNGVTGARLAVQLHARDCAGRGDAEALDVALRQLALLEVHLKRFLELGRTEGLHREPCLVVTLVEEAVTLLRPRCRHTHIELRWQPPQEPITVQGDPGQLEHLLLNVLGNAVDAAGPGGWVEVGCRLVDVSSGPEEEAGRPGTESRSRLVVIEVTDSGPGPPPEVAERLFEPFVTSKRDGVGLGLAVARQVAEAHGGRIAWLRKTDRTCFQIELPLRGDRH